MEIHLENLGKRFGKEWIFRNLNYHFETGKSYALLGPNGSGKSTLLQVLAGIQEPSEGKTSIVPLPEWSLDHFYTKISIAAPYQELIEEFTLSEAYEFHNRFRRFRNHLSYEGFASSLQLPITPDRYIKDFSSGMKQRVKLGLALYTDSLIYFLDEPTTNLDAEGARWYQTQIQLLHGSTLIIVASNVLQEYTFCNHHIRLK